jgi:hypothetical protein
VQHLSKKEPRLYFLLAFLKDYYEEHEWKSYDAEGTFLDFYAKIKLKKEILQIVSGKIKLEDVQLAMHSFTLKSKLWVSGDFSFLSINHKKAHQTVFETI